MGKFFFCLISSAAFRSGPYLRISSAPFPNGLWPLAAGFVFIPIAHKAPVTSSLLLYLVPSIWSVAICWLCTLSAWPYHLSRMDFTHDTISSPCNMFSIFFFILILNRSISFTTTYFLYSLHFSYSKYVRCFRQANLVEIYLIIFDAVVRKVEIFSLRWDQKGTGRHFMWFRPWMSCAFYASLLLICTVTSFFCFWICPLFCPQKRTQCSYQEKGKRHLLLCTWQKGSWFELSGDREVKMEIQFLLSSQPYRIGDLTFSQLCQWRLDSFWIRFLIDWSAEQKIRKGFLPPSSGTSSQSKSDSQGILNPAISVATAPSSKLVTISVSIAVLSLRCKIFPSHVLKAHGGRGCTAPLFLNPRTKWRKRLASWSGCFTTCDSAPGANSLRAVWSRFGRFGQQIKILSLPECEPLTFHRVRCEVSGFKSWS